MPWESFAPFVSAGGTIDQGWKAGGRWRLGRRQCGLPGVRRRGGDVPAARRHYRLAGCVPVKSFRNAQCETPDSGITGRRRAQSSQADWRATYVFIGACV